MTMQSTSTSVGITLYDLRRAADWWRDLVAPDGWRSVYADLARHQGEHLRDFDQRLEEARRAGVFRWRDQARGWGEVRV